MDRVSWRDEVQRAQRVKTAISFYGAGDRGRRRAKKQPKCMQSALFRVQIAGFPRTQNLEISH